MSQQPSITVSHIGICTSNLDRSVTFYTEALGFELAHTIDGLGAPYDHLMELPGQTCNVRHLKSGGVTIELVGFPDAPVTGSNERRPMNQLGFTHMTMIVSNVDAVVAKIVKLGGRVYPETKVDSSHGVIVFCTDPDGVRIELLQLAG